MVMGGVVMEVVVMGQLVMGGAVMGKRGAIWSRRGAIWRDNVDGNGRRGGKAGRGGGASMRPVSMPHAALARLYGDIWRRQPYHKLRKRKPPPSYCKAAARFN